MASTRQIAIEQVDWGTRLTSTGLEGDLEVPFICILPSDLVSFNRNSNSKELSSVQSDRFLFFGVSEAPVDPFDFIKV